jgi:cytochrome c oxidase assembly factor CtaG
MSQSRRWSLYEALINVAVGQVVAIVAQIITFWAMNIPVTFMQNVYICIIFTCVSLIRSYLLRRFFNWVGR